jgi:hypothetical protein
MFQVRRSSGGGFGKKGLEREIFPQEIGSPQR